MADGEVNVKVKITAENGGVTKVESGLDKLGKKAEETAQKTKSGFEQANQTFGKVTKAAGAFQKVLSGFGMIGIATALAGGITKIIDSFRSAKKEAEEFNKAAAEKNVKDGIDALADSYKQLTDAIARANAERTAQNEIDSILHPDWVESIAQESLFCMLARHGDVTPEASQRLRSGIVAGRLETGLPVLMLDWEGDTSFLNRHISEYAVLGKHLPAGYTFPLNIDF